ncbi:MAG: hypothetical protein KTR21_14075 [Rhodobacteraceae bacterium]|nr:hypothetical protein [Paracoccaceae bacterium]
MNPLRLPIPPSGQGDEALIWHRVRPVSSIFRVSPHFGEFPPGGFCQPLFVHAEAVKFNHFSGLVTGAGLDLRLAGVGIDECDRRVFVEAVEAVALTADAAAHRAKAVFKPDESERLPLIVREKIHPSALARSARRNATMSGNSGAYSNAPVLPCE